MGRKTTDEEIKSRIANKRVFIVKKQSPDGGPVSRWGYLAETKQQVEDEMKKDTVEGASATIEAIYPAILVL